MDKAEIYTAILWRNKLRRDNFLPVLDVRTEYLREVAIAGQRDYYARCNERADEREVIRLEVLAELRAKHGETFGNTMGGRWAVGHLTWKRFQAFMALKYGVQRPAPPATRHPLTYGGAIRSDETPRR
jgi:hypothetical protein